MGMFYRTLRMVDNGIKPVYVFDGKPPTLKSGEVQKSWVEKQRQVDVFFSFINTILFILFDLTAR